MKARPILFSGSMVRALLDGRKTQTRRIVKPQPFIDQMGNFCWDGACYGQSPGGAPRVQAIASPIPSSKNNRVLCPYGQPGDLLWVRETWGILHPNGKMAGMPTFEFVRYSREDYEPYFSGEGSVVYKADGKDYDKVEGYKSAFQKRQQCAGRWRSSIHMPRWASRLTPEIIGVRVERLKDISEADAIAEGITKGTNETYWSGVQEFMGLATARDAYSELWQSINGPGSWDANPWVWVLEFRVHRQNIDAFLKARAA